jgi:hypothetical protein
MDDDDDYENWTHPIALRGGGSHLGEHNHNDDTKGE